MYSKLHTQFICKIYNMYSSLNALDFLYESYSMSTKTESAPSVCEMCLNSPMFLHCRCSGGLSVCPCVLGLLLWAVLTELQINEDIMAAIQQS